MHPKSKEELQIRFKLVVLELASELGVSKICKEFNVPRSTFYRWKKRYDREGRAGLYTKKPIAYSHPCKTSPEVIDKILELRRDYQMGALRIMYYLDRYHGIKISESTVSRVLKAHRLNQLPKTAPKRALYTKRYANYREITEFLFKEVRYHYGNSKA